MLRSLVIAALLAACSVQGSRPSPESAWALSVDRLRKSADDHVSQRRLEDAEADLRRILALPSPGSVGRAPELLQDARFALGSVLLLQKRFEAAIAEATAGLAISEAPTVFRANLHALRAMAWEALDRPTEAVVDYEAAVKIHKTLFDAALAVGNPG